MNFENNIDNDEDEASLEKKETLKKGNKEFFFSEKLEKYIAYAPLKIDERVLAVAKEEMIDLDWDDEGRLKNISLIDAKKIMEGLDAELLSPSEYWIAYNEADEETRERMRSDDHVEWLDVVFRKDDDGNVIEVEHPKITENDTIDIGVEGEQRIVNMEIGRPGWFNPDNNIDEETGLPIAINTTREKGSNSWADANWKYWSTFQKNRWMSGIRGYVISSGTPSFDLDIPPNVKEPVLMLRECRKKLIDSAIRQEVKDAIGELDDSYKETIAKIPGINNTTELESFYDNQTVNLINLMSQYGKEIVSNDSLEARGIREKFIDMSGLVSLLAKEKGDDIYSERLKSINKELFGEKDLTIDSFKDFVAKGKDNLSRASEGYGLKTIFVMGHKNPDSDTAISALFEAYRNSLVDQGSVYIPILQSSRIPDEIKELLGEDISSNLILSDSEEYKDLKDSGKARWILVDQNVSEVQKFVISTVDHHKLSDIAKKQDSNKTWEMAGSTASLIAQKYYGMGFKMDEEMSRILYGATLMDTENRGEKKMTSKDYLLMDKLKKDSGVVDDDQFFEQLMSELLNTDDAKLLFDRDYKQDWGVFGFAVAKIKNGFDKEGNELKSDLLKNLRDLAEENNEKKNFPMTLLKVVDYLEDNETVNLERIYMIFKECTVPGFKEKMFEFVEKIIENTFDDRAEIKKGDEYIDFSKVGDQLSRKVVAPFLEEVVRAFNEYYEVDDLGLNIKREFLKFSPAVEKVAADLGIQIFNDKKERVNNITFIEAKKISRALGIEMMSLSEYWKALRSVTENKDEQLISHLKEKDFVEFLDTVIINRKYIIDHPEIIEENGSIEYRGDMKEINIIEGVPGLINIDDIDPESGFPGNVYPPSEQGSELWRYWSPDADICIPTRGHIFLLDQPAFDTKIHPDDALPNLGIRPCRKEVIPPEIDFKRDEQDNIKAVIRKSI
ncbi:MAG: DHH family phosphoesterase [Candidatus Pacebacteria bacterium]|nr:DHH family phosphoesterase [Candidatus Paceibacterota bacterium]